MAEDPSLAILRAEMIRARAGGGGSTLVDALTRWEAACSTNSRKRGPSPFLGETARLRLLKAQAVGVATYIAAIDNSLEKGTHVAPCVEAVLERRQKAEQRSNTNMNGAGMTKEERLVRAEAEAREVQRLRERDEDRRLGVQRMIEEEEAEEQRS